jgi:bifunctional DNA-binding transcriptional regulator/antitoxin component of YhaV-PrlF toxin-antitoxin module
MYAIRSINNQGANSDTKKLRDKYKLNPGTRVLFEETDEGIILKQVDADFIKNAKGMVPKKKGDKPVSG